MVQRGEVESDIAWDPDREFQDRPVRRKDEARRQRIGLIVASAICAICGLGVSAFMGLLRLVGPPTSDSPQDLIISMAGAVIIFGLIIGGLGALVLHQVTGRGAPRGGGLRRLGLLTVITMVAATPLMVFHHGQWRQDQADAFLLAAVGEEYDDRILAISDRDDRIRRRAEARARLIPSAITAPGGLAEARSAMVELRQIQHAIWQETEALDQEYERRIEGLQIRDDWRTNAVEGIRETRRLNRQIQRLEEQALANQQAQLNILTRPGGWRRGVGGAPQFVNPADATAFDQAAREGERIKAERDRY